MAGLAAGDVITSLGAHPLTSASAIQAVMGEHHPGDKISSGWVDSAGRVHTAIVTLASGPAG
jgi:S1-C subfamily serine protease